MKDPIIIKDFDKGIAPSPHKGFGKLVNLDVSTDPGVVQLGYKATEYTTITGAPLWFFSGAGSSYYGMSTSAGNVYYNSNTEAWGPVAGGDGRAGLATWKGYIFAFGATTIDVNSEANLASPSWTTNWQTITSATYHPTIHGQDDKLYFGAGKYVGSLAEVSGQTFAPGTGGTFTFNGTALNLPSQYTVTCLAELGRWLAIGTTSGKNTADIFFWDRTSASFNMPIRVRDQGVHAMVAVNNKLYFNAGYRGDLYVTDGTNVEKVASLPTSIIGTSSIKCVPNGMDYHDGKVIYGFIASDGDFDAGYGAVWGYDTRTGALTVEYTASAGLVETTAITYVASINKTTVSFGMASAGVTGATYTTAVSDRKATGYMGIVESPLYQVGTDFKKATLEDIEFILDRPLATGEGIKLSYRTNLSASYTLIGTWDYTTNGAITSARVPSGITDAEHVQIKAELTTGATSTTSPHLKEIILY